MRQCDEETIPKIRRDADNLLVSFSWLCFALVCRPVLHGLNADIALTVVSSCKP